MFYNERACEIKTDHIHLAEEKSISSDRQNLSSCPPLQKYFPYDKWENSRNYGEPDSLEFGDVLSSPLS